LAHRRAPVEAARQWVRRGDLDFALERYQSRRFRLYILAWNQRSRNVAARLGFAVESVVQSDEGPFVVMVRDRSGADPAPRSE
jgi:RimJ/RimL family protein N-acetyltransferase